MSPVVWGAAGLMAEIVASWRARVAGQGCDDRRATAWTAVAAACTGFTVVMCIKALGSP